MTIAYRAAAFTRAKPKNREAAALAQREGRLRVLMNCVPTQIFPDRVVLMQNDQSTELANDAVIINAGGILPTEFLRSIGIETETKYGSK